jgi:hypothetical protein
VKYPARAVNVLSLRPIIFYVLRVVLLVYVPGLPSVIEVHTRYVQALNVIPKQHQYRAVPRVKVLRVAYPLAANLLHVGPGRYLPIQLKPEVLILHEERVERYTEVLKVLLVLLIHVPPLPGIELGDRV